MKKIIISIASFFILIILVVTLPLVYNYHLFSLARLKNNINVGDEYQEVFQKFKKYESNHQKESELQVSIDDDQMFIYHENIFDDCQLTVKFGADKKVKTISYIGD